MGARQLVAALGGSWHGHYGMARCPAHADRTPSLSVREADDGRILLYDHAGCPQDAVIDALSARGLWPSRRERPAWTPPDPTELARRERERREEERRLQDLVRRLWRGARPAAGTDAERYLRARFLTTVALPPTLRFARLNHSPSGEVWPCMVAAVQDGAGRLVGLYRTFVAPGGVGKAPVTKPKMLLGCGAGAAVRLAPAGPTLCLVEGIEDGLSVQQETGLLCWATLGTSNLDKLTLPEVVRGVIVCADNDPAGEAAARAAARAYLAVGREVRIARPPAGFKDFNNLLRAEASAREAA